MLGTMVKLWSNSPHQPSQNPTEPHRVNYLNYCKQRKDETSARIAADSKSADRKVVGVRPPLPAPINLQIYYTK